MGLTTTTFHYIRNIDASRKFRIQSQTEVCCQCRVSLIFIHTYVTSLLHLLRLKWNYRERTILPYGIEVIKIVYVIMQYNLI